MNSFLGVNQDFSTAAPSFPKLSMKFDSWIGMFYFKILYLFMKQGFFYFYLIFMDSPLAKTFLKNDI